MASMIAELNAKIPSYIRCIKPNEKKRPNQFDAKLVLNQGRRSAKDRRNDISSVCRQFGTSVSSRTFVFAERVSAIACRRINFSNGIGEVRVVPCLTISLFFCRFKLICPHTYPVWSDTVKEGVSEILLYIGILADEYQFGRTKVFIKNPQTVN